MKCDDVDVKESKQMATLQMSAMVGELGKRRCGATIGATTSSVFLITIKGCRERLALPLGTSLITANQVLQQARRQ